MADWEKKIDIRKVFVLQPTRPTTYFGVGAVGKVGDILAGLAAKGTGKVLVVTDAVAYTASGAWKTVKPALDAHVAWKHYDKVRPNPTYANCEEAAAMGLDFGAGAILAIGGGSAMDTAKTAAVLMQHPGKKSVDFYEKGEPITGALPLVLINTSHGTGSECDAFAVAQSDGEDKPAINSPHIYATFTIEDPALTATMPTKQTISTSIDAVNHALEAATTITTTPYSIGLARDAIRLVATYLPTAIVEPGNLTARYWLMYASAIAGISFDLGLLHITHAMEHAMSTLNAAVTHGDGLGILMPAMVQEIYPAVPEVVADLFAPIIPGLKGVPGETDFVVGKLRQWCHGVGQATSMAAYYSEADIPALTQTAMASSLSKMLFPLAPVPVSEELIARIFRNSL
ncbi:iron-containing alcohol dehydrogenase [Solidesulfovibrio alcoholivorans]|uniref:iron-containing alcohol dehydrogenase n=1 Tax=Solidesulfovibrio alcoholivorans TaxID=81406 RepID=UPI0004976C27|nr:iron-containing alcohol dehydrogenase [Solidesulfovibrio alcoholivorans]